ncbi:hypothetical protein J6590_025091 [Homalodisca vitripennis]|nr:hypothetical protein J6590_025091 [Homalodisca vitripennis]
MGTNSADTESLVRIVSDMTTCSATFPTAGSHRAMMTPNLCYAILPAPLLLADFPSHRGAGGPDPDPACCHQTSCGHLVLWSVVRGTVCCLCSATLRLRLSNYYLDFDRLLYQQYGLVETFFDI